MAHLVLQGERGGDAQRHRLEITAPRLLDELVQVLAGGFEEPPGGRLGRPALDLDLRRARGGRQGELLAAPLVVHLVDATGAGDAFEGYSTTRVSGVPVVALFDAHRQPVEVLSTDQHGYAALAKTPFYLEAGGQVSDSGRIINAATARSQLVGGMTMGLSMALHEEGRLDDHSAAAAAYELGCGSRDLLRECLTEAVATWVSDAYVRRGIPEALSAAGREGEP